MSRRNLFFRRVFFRLFSHVLFLEISFYCNSVDIMISLIASRISVRGAREVINVGRWGHRRFAATASSTLEDSRKNDKSHHDSDETSSDFFFDAREKLPGVIPTKIMLTDRPIEAKIIYNSLAHSFRDKAPFLERVIKQKLLASRNRRREQQELMEKEVDSIVAARMMEVAPEKGNNTHPS